MNNEESSIFKVFLKETMANGLEVTRMDHVAEPVKNTVRDLLKVCENVTRLMDNSSGQNADSRILKKKYEQTKIDLNQATKKFEKTQALIVSLLEEIQEITNSAELIIKANSGQTNPKTIQETLKIQNAAQKLSTKIMQFNP
jgi:hypothetical protein